MQDTIETTTETNAQVLLFNLGKRTQGHKLLFQIPVEFEGESKPVIFSVSNQVPKHYPFHREWMMEMAHQDAAIPTEIMASFEKLYSIARKNDVHFLDLCHYAINQRDGKQEEIHDGTD